jgi:hypothetical protein
MSFKVIDGDGPGKEAQDLERNREWAKHEFSWAIRETAANTLRIIRGAGKPHDHAYLDPQQTCGGDALLTFRVLARREFSPC